MTGKYYRITGTHFKAIGAITEISLDEAKVLCGGKPINDYNFSVNPNHKILVYDDLISGDCIYHKRARMVYIQAIDKHEITKKLEIFLTD